jgi:hypothetical protein
MVAQGTVFQMVQNVLSRIPKSENLVVIKSKSENVEIKKTETKPKNQTEG